MSTLKSVLLFSKDPDCRKALNRVTKQCSDKISTFTDELEVLAYLRKETVDMVIMSLNSNVEGTPLCEAIRAIDPHVPILLISDESGLGDYSLYFKGVDTLNKPLDAEVLLRKVKLYKTLTDAQITLEKISYTRRETDK